MPFFIYQEKGAFIIAIVNNLLVRAGADFSGMRKEMKKASQDLADFKGKISKTMGAITATLAGIGIGKVLVDATKQAITFQASVGQINRQMGSSAKAFDEWAKSGAKAFGLGRTSAIQYGATFGNLISNFASGTDDVRKKTEDLLKASGVVASATGKSMQEVTERIRSGLLGETDAIEDLGINVNQAMLTSTAAFKKFAGDQSWSQLSFQTQQQILYFAILEQASKKYGDTIADNTGTKLLMFTETLKDVKTSLGQAFLPILNVVLPVLTKLAQGLLTVMNIVAQFSQALFGKAIMKDSKQQSTAINSQAASVGGLGDAYKAAGKDAKKASKEAAGGLASFDEFNTLPDTSSASADDTGADAGAVAGLGDVGGMTIPAIEDSGFISSTLEVSKKVQEMADKVRSLLGGINFKPLVDSFNKIKTALAPITAKLFSGLQWAFQNILIPLGKWTIQSLLPSFLDAVAGALKVLNPLLTAFQTLGQWLWDNFLQQIAKWTGSAIVDTLKGLVSVLTTIGDWMSKNQKVVTNTTAAIAVFFGAWKVVELLAFIQTSGGLVSAFGTIKKAVEAATVAKIANAYQTVVLSAMYAKDLVVAIAASAAEMAKSTIKWIASTAAMVTNKVALAASTIAQIAMTAATIAWNAAVTVGTALTTAFGVAMSILTAPITLVIAAIALLVAGVYLLITHWDDVKKAAGAAWDFIKDKWAIAWKWLDENVVSPISNGLGSMFEGVGKAASIALNGMKKVWGDAVGWLYGNVIKPIGNMYVDMFNVIINGVNAVTSALNKISIDIPDALGGGHIGFNIPQIPKIPKLARGGIVDGKTDMGNYVAGEAGAEMVVPLENTSFTDKIASALGSAVLTAMQMGQSNQGGGQQVIQMDGVTVARVLNKYLNNENTRLGGSLINVT